MENNKAFNDDYNIDERFQQIKEVLIESEKDLFKFIGPTRNKKAATRFRKNMNEIRRMIHQIRKAVQYQRQVNDSVYESK